MENPFGWPTEAEIAAYAEDYAAALALWIAQVMAEVADMENPHTLNGYEILRTVGTLCPEQEGHARAAHCIWRHYDELRAPWGIEYFPVHLTCVERVRALNEQARVTLYEWWRQSPCVDFCLPSPPADCDHGKRRILEAFAYAGTTHKRVEQVGQIVLLSQTMPGYGEKRPGTLLIDAHSARLICVWKDSDGGGLAAARECAQELSLLTDWRQFDAFTPRQRRAAGLRVQYIHHTCREAALAAR